MNQCGDKVTEHRSDGIHIPYIDNDTGIVFFGLYGHIGHYGPFEDIQDNLRHL